MVRFGDDYLISLPVAYTSVLLSQWLDVKDVAEVDSAYCNSAKRVALHALLSSPQIVLTAQSSIKAQIELMNWLLCKGIRIDRLMVVHEINPIYLQYTTKFGMHVDQIVFRNVDFDIAGTNYTADACQLVGKCPSLLVIALEDCEHNYRSTMVLLKSIAKCTVLKAIHFGLNFDPDQNRLCKYRTERLLNPSQHSTPPRTPLLQLVELELLVSWNISLAVLKLCYLGHLTTFEIVLYKTDGQLYKKLCDVFDQCTNLKELTLIGDFPDEYLITLLHKCPTIKGLWLCSAEKLTDASVPAIVALPVLAALDVSNNSNYSDVLLHALATYCAGTLKGMITRNCVGISSAGIEHLISHCTKLQVVSIDTHGDLTCDLSLLPSLDCLIIKCGTEVNLNAFVFELSLHSSKLENLYIEGPTFNELTFDFINAHTFPVLARLKFVWHTVDSVENKELLAVTEANLKRRCPRIEKVCFLLNELLDE